MGKAKYIVIVVIVAGIGIFVANRFFQSEEALIIKQFNLMAELGSKKAGENKLATASKINKIKKMFAENCMIAAPAYSKKNFTKQDIPTIGHTIHSGYSELATSFHDIEINLLGEKTAKALLTAKLSGKLSNGQKVADRRELQCVLNKIENEWLLTDIELIDEPEE